MIIRGTPKDITEYYLSDGEVAFRLQQAGFKPVYIDEDAIYFKKNKKLQKFLSKFDIIIEL